MKMLPIHISFIFILPFLHLVRNLTNMLSHVIPNSVYQTQFPIRRLDVHDGVLVLVMYYKPGLQANSEMQLYKH